MEKMNFGSSCHTQNCIKKSQWRRDLLVTDKAIKLLE